MIDPRMEVDVGRPYRVAAIVGSLRSGSHNRLLLRAAQEVAPPELRLVEVPIADLPLYDGDIEAAGDPPAVVRFKDALREADAFLIVTPEYNHSIPGVLKNALDWASRRHHGQLVLAGKPAAIVGASAGRFGTVRAQLDLRQILPYFDLRLLPKPEVYVAFAGDKFNEAGNLTDGPTREQVAELLGSFLDWIRVLRPRPRGSADCLP